MIYRGQVRLKKFTDGVRTVKFEGTRLTVSFRATSEPPTLRAPSSVGNTKDSSTSLTWVAPGGRQDTILPERVSQEYPSSHSVW